MVSVADKPITFKYSRCTSVEDERRHRKQRLAAAFRIFAQLGLNEGLAGHITARDPELVDHFWVNPFPVEFARVRVRDLVLVNSAGEIVEGGGRSILPAAYAIHSEVHRARPDVIAAAHSHSMYGKAWAALGRPLEPITQDHCDFFKDHALYDGFGGVAEEVEEGRRIAEALGRTKAVIMRNHGLLTVGHTVDEAAGWFIRMERCCRISLLAEAAGSPVLIGDEIAQGVYEHQGSHIAGWALFQPFYDRLVEEQPDVLE